MVSMSILNQLAEKKLLSGTDQNHWGGQPTKHHYMTQKIRPAKPTGSVTTSSWEMFQMKGFIANDDLLKSDHKILNSPAKVLAYWVNIGESGKSSSLR